MQQNSQLLSFWFKMWLLLLVVGVLSYFLYKLKLSSNYWKKYDVPTTDVISQLDRIPVFLGKKTTADLDEIVYKSLGKSEKFVGFVELGQPILLVKDIEVVKKILIKDFDHFVDRRGFTSGSERQKIFDHGLFNMKGDKWKGVRTALSPTFTTGKIRRMMDIFNGISNDWVDHFKEALEKNGGKSVAVNIEKESVNYTVEAISAAVFGMKSGTIRNPKATFATMAHKLNKVDTITTIKFMTAIVFPKLLKLLQIDLIDQEALSFFESLLKQGIKTRREGKVVTNDFLQLLIEASKGQIKAVGSDDLDNFEEDAKLKNVEKKNWITDEVIDGSMLQFFFAGFGTTANFIGFTMYMLTLHPEIQSKLREELNSKLFSKMKDDKEEIDYDELNKLVYLDMVCNEVLRKFPALARLERECTKDFKDPSEGLTIPEGTVVAIPVQAIHNDPEFYEFPDKFYPEHFAPEKKASRSPYTFLSFGSGPRNCIGMRFALIEGKAAIAHIVHNFVLEPTSKTPTPITAKPVGIAVQMPDDLEISIRLAK